MDFVEFKKKFQKIEAQEYTNSVDENPVVSICVQTYQHVNYIKQCLDGILMQETTFPFEILLGEDASTDGTREICLEYAKKYTDKIRLFSHHRENNIKINGKPTGRFNFMYNFYVARGKYIALCEGDDYWIDPFKLQKQVDFLEKNTGVDLCFHRAHLLTNNGFKIHNVPLPFLEKSFNFIQLLKHFNFIATASVIFRRPEPFNLPNWFSTVPFGDLGLYKIVSQEKHIACVNEVMCVYRIQPKGLWSGLNKRSGKMAYLSFYKNIYKALDKDEKKVVKNKAEKLIREIAKSKFQHSTLKQIGYYCSLKFKIKLWSLN